MSHRGIGISCLGFTLLIAGCGSPQPDDLIKKSIVQWEEAALLLEGISDESTLRDASKKLDALAQQMVEINKKASEQEMDVDTKRRLVADNRKESETVLSRFNNAAKKVREIPGGESVIVRFRRSASRTF